MATSFTQLYQFPSSHQNIFKININFSCQGWSPVLASALGGQGGSPQDPGDVDREGGAGAHNQHGRWHTPSSGRRPRAPWRSADGECEVWHGQRGSWSNCFSFSDTRQMWTLSTSTVTLPSTTPASGAMLTLPRTSLGPGPWSQFRWHQQTKS